MSVFEACRKAYEAGSEPGNVYALVDALMLGGASSRNKDDLVSVPAWAVQGAVARIMKSLRPLRERALSDRRDFERLLVLDALRDAFRPAGWRRRAGEPAREGAFDEAGGTIYERAARALEGSFAEGKPDAIRKAEARTRKRLAANPDRYRVPLFVLLDEERPDRNKEARATKALRAARAAWVKAGMPRRADSQSWKALRAAARALDVARQKRLDLAAREQAQREAVRRAK
ncbi:MAG: hypothetical protein KJ067_23550 [Vicinamibacteria bacterium]|nr:hypothetical protein [Vicinamibacteria bacterium]